MARLPATMGGEAARWPRVDAPSVCELVADAVHRQHVPRIAWIWLDFAADILHVRVDRAIERGRLAAANGVEQLRPREDAPRLAGHGRQQCELGRSQIDNAIANAGLHALLVEPEVAGGDRVAALGRRVDAPEHRLHARDELARAERLGDVVVGAGFE